MRRLLGEYVPVVCDYWDSATSGHRPVVEWTSPKELMGKVDVALNEEPDSAAALREAVDATLKYSVATAHPRFTERLYAGTTPIGVLSEMLATVLNTNNHTYSVAPVFSLMEDSLLRGCRQLLGLPCGGKIDLERLGGTVAPPAAAAAGGEHVGDAKGDSADASSTPAEGTAGSAAAAASIRTPAAPPAVPEGEAGTGTAGVGGAAELADGSGVFCPGGSYANMLAMLAARERACPGIFDTGMSGRRLVCFCSAASHYSVTNAAGTCGLGTANAIAVDCLPDGSMDMVDLGRRMRKAIAEGATPFFVSLTAGTTVTGAFDNIAAARAVIDEVCAEAAASASVDTRGGAGGKAAAAEPVAAAGGVPEDGIWLHVDGSWGGSAIFSDRYRHRLEGSSRCDSFVLNPHKLLGVPLQTSCLVTRAPFSLRDGARMAPYLFHTSVDDEARYNVGTRTLQCGRKCDALKFYFAWRRYGRVGLGRMVDNAFDRAVAFENVLRRDPRFRVAMPASCANVLFWWLPPAMRDAAQEPGQLAPTGTHGLREGGRLDELHDLVPALAQRMRMEGEAVIDFAPSRDPLLPNMFRLITANALLREEDVSFIVEAVDRAGRMELLSRLEEKGAECAVGAEAHSSVDAADAAKTDT